MTAQTIAIVLAGILFFAVIALALITPGWIRYSRSPLIAELPPEHPTESELKQLQDRLAESQRLIGERDAAHRNELIQVKSEALIEMQAYKASLDLEHATKKRSDARETAARSRASLVAKIGEHFAPLLAGFPYNFKDARHVGEIFDYLVFDGLEDGKINQVVFLEVKTKKSGARVTNPREKMLKEAIEAGRVVYDIFVPDVSGAKRDDITD